MGLVDSPPPTHRSNPGVPSGPVTPTKEMSLISCAVHWDGHPLIAVLYFRGRLVNSGLAAATASVARSVALASRISSAQIPATGQPRMLRGTSPQAWRLDRPTSSRRSQISGTSSIRIQWNCTFCRSVMSARSRPYSLPMLATVRNCSAESWPPGILTHHEERVFDLGILQRPGLAAPDSRAALGVQAPPAEPAAQVLWVDGAEALVRVAGEDPVTDVEPVVVLLESFGRVQRLTMARRPLALAAMGPGWHVSIPSAARGAAPQAGASGTGGS